MMIRWYVAFERTAKDLAQIELRKAGKVGSQSRQAGRHPFIDVYDCLLAFIYVHDDCLLA